MKMQFEKVTELVPGTKYKVKYCDVVTYEGTYIKRDGNYRIFKNVTGTGFTVKLFKQDVSGHHDFYVPIFQRDRIQSAMERRALNLILQNITGDSTFVAEGFAPTIPQNQGVGTSPYNPVITVITVITIMGS